MRAHRSICGDWLAEILRRKKFEERRYDRILKLTRVYYNEFSDYYVNFYGDWLKGEGGFCDPKYKEGYDMVAKVLHNTATHTPTPNPKHT